MKALEMPEPCLHSEDKDFSRYPLGKTDWAEAQIRASWGVIWASRAPSGFAEVRLAEVLHPQITQESLGLFGFTGEICGPRRSHGVFSLAFSLRAFLPLPLGIPASLAQAS